MIKLPPKIVVNAKGEEENHFPDDAPALGSYIGVVFDGKEGKYTFYEKGDVIPDPFEP